ncbi:MAG: dnaE, partial [Acidimicrobiia bacterium]|nr:dnaE [Acidimicrobiia bacterium]
DFTALPIDQVPPGLTVPAGAPGAIPFGLSAVRNVGEGLVKLLIEERTANGPFVDFYDFCERVDPQVLNKRAVESLIKAGGFDQMGHPRRGLLTVCEQIIDRTLERRRERDQGVMSLFGDLGGDAGPAFDERVNIPDFEFDKRERLANEKEMLGLYVSDHPLLGAEHALRKRTDCTIDEASERPDGEFITLGGVITSLQRKYTRKGDLMAVFVLEDLQSSIEVTVFPRMMMEQGHKLADDLVVCVKGRLDSRDDTPKLMAQEITVPELITDGAPPLRLRFPTESISEDQVRTLQRMVVDHPGESQVFLHLGDGGKVLRLPEKFCVDLANGLMGEIKSIFGSDAVLA